MCAVASPPLLWCCIVATPDDKAPRRSRDVALSTFSSADRVGPLLGPRDFASITSHEKSRYGPLRLNQLDALRLQMMALDARTCPSL